MEQEEVGRGGGRQRQKTAPQSLPPSLWLPGSLPRSEWDRGHPALPEVWMGEGGRGRPRRRKCCQKGQGRGECPVQVSALSSSACP